MAVGKIFTVAECGVQGSCRSGESKAVRQAAGDVDGVVIGIVSEGDDGMVVCAGDALSEEPLHRKHVFHLAARAQVGS
ncbi:hypothetical protein BHM03_00043043 [Ensete ventricosum]|nr:hypothetical protein BHM03_00043043 [Ensete ventricosum]